MKIITLWQPWASLIALGEKRIETRSWKAPESLLGQRIAIHAGKRQEIQIIYMEPFKSVFKKHGFIEGTCLHLLPTSCILATAKLVDCLPVTARFNESAFIGSDSRLITVEGNEYYFGDYTPGRYAWILEDIKPLPKPIPAKGKQGLWNWEGDEIAASDTP